MTALPPHHMHWLHHDTATLMPLSGLDHMSLMGMVDHLALAARVATNTGHRMPMPPHTWAVRLRAAVPARHTPHGVHAQPLARAPLVDHFTTHATLTVDFTHHRHTLALTPHTPTPQPTVTITDLPHHVAQAVARLAALVAANTHL